MIPVRDYDNLLLAQDGVILLLENEILAQVRWAYRRTGLPGISGVWGTPRMPTDVCRVFVARAEDVEAAVEVLNQLEDTPIKLDEDWEDQAELSGTHVNATEARVDLGNTKMASLNTPCDRCEYPLGGLRTIGRCPECGHPYDKAEILGKLLDPGRR